MPQPSRPSRIPLLLITLSAATTAAGAYLFLFILLRNGLGILDLPLTLLYAAFLLWISLGFWTATFGLIFEWTSQPVVTLPNNAAPLPRTAILMTIRNQDVVEIFSGLAAMYEDLARTGKSASFDFFILSDTSDPDIWLEEEEAWATLKAMFKGCGGLYYRRRAANIDRKQGNIRDFCERWGKDYLYMVILEADCLLEGRTLLHMVRRMEQDPRIGILQSTSLPVCRRTFLARLQQFAGQFHGRIFLSGYELWFPTPGNYWGRNAILRIKPFMDCCNAPELPNNPSRRDTILSRHLAEAARLRDGGWKVVVDHNLKGAYESCSTNLLDFARRDRQWCRATLRDFWPELLRGLNPISRPQLGMGPLSFLAAPVCILFLLLAALISLTSPYDAGAAIVVLVGTMLLMLLPQFWALLLILRYPLHSDGFGGSEQAVASAAIESACSLALAPILMAFRAASVTAAALGIPLRWMSPSRSNVLPAFPEFARFTIAGLVATLIIAWFIPDLGIWFAPLLLPLILSIPISLLLDSRRIANWLLSHHLLAIPEEIWQPHVIQRQRLFHYLRESSFHDAPNPFLRAIVDPRLHTLHQRLLAPHEIDSQPAEDIERLRTIALTGGSLSKRERMRILQDPDSMDWLHRHAWTEWPVELLERCSPNDQQLLRLLV